MERVRSLAVNSFRIAATSTRKVGASCKIAWPYLQNSTAFSVKYAIVPLAILLYKILQVSLMPLVIFVSTVLVSTIVGQLVLASVALWISVNIFRIDPLAFLKTEQGEVELPEIFKWVTPQSIENLIEKHPERALELLDLFN